MLTATEKNLALCQLEKLLQDAKDSAGISALSDISSAIEAERTKYDSDPATVTAANLQSARENIENFTFGKVGTLTGLWSEIATEATSTP